MYASERAAAEIAVTVGGLIRLPFLLARFLTSKLWRSWNSYRSASWPPITGTVEAVNVVVRRTCLTRLVILDFADAELAYSYQCDGERYAGYHRREFFDEQRAWNYADRWKGQQVMVRCDSRDPGRSYLRIEDQPAMFLADTEQLFEKLKTEKAKVVSSRP
jgi:hypothetical protein